MHLIKNLARRCLESIPFEVRRREVTKSLPPATFDSIKLALAYYSESTTHANLLVVGACDGVSGDPSHDFIKSGRIHAILVEPIEQSFQKLTQVYAGMPNVTLIRAAIARHEGEMTIYKVKEGASSIDAYWGSQLASFDKKHILKHRVADNDIESVVVPCLSLASLSAKCNFESIDILQVDTEGFDAVIVKMALELTPVPECISFENEHLDDCARREVFQLLEQHGYVWTHDNWNTLALHDRLIQRWTRRRSRGQ